MFRAIILAALLACVASNVVAQSQDECHLCLVAVGYVENALSNNQTDAAVADVLEVFCDLLPGGNYKETCDEVAHNLPATLKLFEQSFPPQEICELASACPVNSTVPEVAGGSDCSYCTFIAGALENFLSENTTETEIEDFLNKLCALLPSDYASECQSFVDTYLPDIVYDIDSNEAPSVLCDQIGLCTSSMVARKSPHEVAVADSIARIGEGSADECSYCELIVTAIDTFVNNPQDVENYVDDICEMLPAKDATLCESLVTAYLPMALNYLSNVDSPTDVCVNDLKVCPANRAAKAGALRPKIVKSDEQKSAALAAKTEGGDACSLCEFVASALDNFVSENTTETEIEDFLDNLCSLLPGDFGTECSDFVDTYLPLVLYDLLNDMSPDALCSDIGLCSTKLARKQRLGDGSDCSLCELVFSALENFVTENTTETEIEDFLDNLCNLLPSGDQSQCAYLVSTYLPDLLYDLSNDLSPADACSDIGLCNSSAVVVPAQKEEASNDLCALCSMAVGYIESALTDQNTEAEIEEVLGDVCAVLPADLASVCNDFVDNELPEVLASLEQRYPPAQVCSALSFCGQQRSSISIN